MIIPKSFSLLLLKILLPSMFANNSRLGQLRRICDLEGLGISMFEDKHLKRVLEPISKLYMMDSISFTVVYGVLSSA